MSPKTRITRQGTIHYLECLSCGVEKTTRTQRQKKLCRSCSDKNKRKEDVAEGLRECKVCKMIFPCTSEHFYSKDSKTGRLDRACKTCDDKRKNKWNSDNREQKNEQSRRSYSKNVDAIREKTRERRKNDPSIQAYHRDYYEKNKEHIRELNRSTNYKKVRNLNQRKRRQEPAERMKHNVSNIVRRALKNQGSTKGGSTFSALPYSPQDLVEHLERQFDDKMNWDNYGDYWHVDHIYPQSLLPYSSLEDENFQKCWALENLQPLEATENMKKSNKVL